ncbi:MAG TPA: hypothetical protein VJX16_11735 [Terriglobales bacterium]|nr:hypothetical protein [Terriglobales bacterium]
MKRLALVSVIILVLGVAAVATARLWDRASAQRTYISPDGTFQFSYPAWFSLTADSEHFQGWLCQDFIVCLQYPREMYKGSDFGPTEFWVDYPRQLLDVRGSAQRVTSRSDCLSFRTYTEPVSTTVINGVGFSTLSRDGVAAGTVSDVRFFRTFHKGKCYELGTALSISAGGYVKEDYESGRVTHFTDADRKKVEAVLNDIVRTFRFLK